MRTKNRATVPKMETDLLRIQHLSAERDGENWEFRSWLKQYAPNDIDGIVKTLSQKYFALTRLNAVRNCCRSLHIEFKKEVSFTRSLPKRLANRWNHSKNNRCQMAR